MNTKKALVTVAFGIISLGILGNRGWSHDYDYYGEKRCSTAQDFLNLDVRPLAIGHHGVGPNQGENPLMPIENTVASVREAYQDGARVVEVDVQLTGDGRLAVFHDDFLDDFTCVHDLTLKQLQKRLSYVPELREVLEVARHFNKKANGELGGILIVELKAFSPHCDPLDELEAVLVSTAIGEVRKAHMAEQVIFDSFSPSLLYLASQAAPEIPRELDLSGLQLLSPQEITAITGLPVKIIEKQNSLGLTWAEIGPVYRLPGYSSIEQFLATGFATRATIVGFEMNFLGPAEQQQPGTAAAIVAAAHSLGFRVFADPANTADEWNFFAAQGVDAIYSVIPLGTQLQPPIPER
jgi:glycerophosphoryl diester phosphodiesterase